MSAIVIYENDGTVSYTIGATPSAGPLAIDFPWFFSNEIVVDSAPTPVPPAVPAYVRLVEGADYDLDAVPADDGFHSGSVVLTPARANCTIRINRSLRTDKSSNFPETGAISIPAMNTLFSRLFSWIQDLARRQVQSVVDQLGNYLPLAGGTMTGHIVLRTGPAASNAVRRDYVDAIDTRLSAADTTLQNNINLKANIASPALTGAPTSTTSLVTDPPSGRIATTGYISQILGTRDQGDGVWAYGGTAVADPGPGNYRMLNTGGSNRTLSIDIFDDDGIGRILNLLRVGDSLVFTTEVTPVTGYARYDITGTATHNPGWSQIPMTMSSTGTFNEAPAIGTRYRITGFLNTAAGSAPITQVSVTAPITGGGSTGVVTIGINSAYAGFTPIGGIVDFAGTAAPTGWLLCNAQLVTVAAYPLLYAVLSTRFNLGGETGGVNFRVPDCRGRVSAGVDGGAGVLPSGTLAALLGNPQSAMISESQLALHGHGITYAGAAETIPLTAGGGAGNYTAADGVGETPIYYSTLSATNDTGANLGFSVIQGTIVLNKIIRAL